MCVCVCVCIIYRVSEVCKMPYHVHADSRECALFYDYIYYAHLATMRFLSTLLIIYIYEFIL